MHPPSPHRRLLIAGAAATLALPAWAQPRSTLPAMTDGPFYPSAAWRKGWDDWDADLTVTRRGSQTLVARGEHLGLALSVLDRNGRTIDNAAKRRSKDGASVFPAIAGRPAGTVRTQTVRHQDSGCKG